VLIARDNLVTARDVGDGRYVIEDQFPDFQQRLREGDPTCGWAGDDRLSLVANVEQQQMEVWRAHPDGTRQRVCKRPGLHLPGPDLLVKLAQIDTRHVDVVGEVDRHNAKVERDRATDAADHTAEVADRLHHALTTALAEPAADGRIVGGGKR